MLAGKALSKPTYIGIGAQKCASSWLHLILEEHPEVGVCETKEVDFFSFHFERGYQWYESQFEGCENKLAVGEISPSYLCDPAVPARVAAYSPDIRILVTLRDPVERALSNHRHEVRLGRMKEGDLTFEAGLANNPMYIEQGRYATHLKRWLSHFSLESIKVVLMDDIVSDPRRVAREVYEFVGVDPSYVPSRLDQKFNVSHANRFRGLLNVKDATYSLTRNPAISWLWTAASAIGLKSLYRRVNVRASDAVIPQPSDRILQELRSQFAPEVRELSSILGRSLDHWLGADDYVEPDIVRAKEA